MRKTSLTIALTVLPAVAIAQQASSSSSASASATAKTSAQAEVAIPTNYSADASAQIRAAFERARARNVPEDQLRQRMAEGQAKGASDADVATAVQKNEARLEASQSLLIKAGRANPEPAEINNAALAIERGIAEAKVLAAITNPPANASVAASLNALLQANGGLTGAAAGATAGVTGAVAGAVTRPPTKP
jgi:hypothetical protein